MAKKPSIPPQPVGSASVVVSAPVSTPRKIVQIATGASVVQGISTLYALADDGTLWVKQSNGQPWVEQAGLPHRATK